VLRALGETRICLLSNVLTAVCICLGVSVGVHWGNTGVALAWLLVYPLMLVPLYVRTFQRLQIRPAQYLEALAPALSSGAVMAAAVLACDAWVARGESPWLRLLLQVTIGALSYGGFAWLVYPERIRAFAAVLRAAIR
jgi:O-antigen/teichoic acid export membrane protein